MTDNPNKSGIINYLCDRKFFKPSAGAEPIVISDAELAFQGEFPDFYKAMIPDLVEFKENLAEMSEQELLALYEREKSKDPQNQTKNLSQAPSFPREGDIADDTISFTKKSLLKMVYGMAITKYGYVPSDKKNAVTGEKAGSIFADLDLLGLKVDSGTIRDCLKAAVEEFGDKAPKDP